MWTLVVGVVAWNTWPVTYLSAEPDAIPAGADVTYLMNGILKEGETVSHEQFAARIKAKYPEYSDLTDEELVTRTLQKFPQYSSYVRPPDLDDNGRPIKEQDGDSIGALNRANRNSAIRFALMLWLLPPIAVYALGASIGWVRRGFRST